MEMFSTNMTMESISTDRYEEGKAEGKSEMVLLLHKRNLEKGMTADESVREMAATFHITEEEVKEIRERDLR